MGVRGLGLFVLKEVRWEGAHHDRGLAREAAGDEMPQGSAVANFLAPNLLILLGGAKELGIVYININKGS